LLDEFPKLAAGLRIEAGGWFIEKKKIGIPDERAREGEALLLAAGKIADAGILFFFELDEGDGFVGAGALLEKAAEETKRFVDGELFGELRVLQLNAEALAKLFGVGTPVHAEKFDFAGVRSGEAFANFDGGGFPRAVGSEKAEAFAGAHFEIEAIDSDDVLIGLAKTSDAKGRSGGSGGHGNSIASAGGTCKIRIDAEQEATGGRL